MSRIATNNRGTSRILEGEILVDLIDRHLLRKYKWYINKRGYAAFDKGNSRNPNRLRLLLHRIIMKAKNGEIVDHIDGNTLNNKRKNLRKVSKAENNQNRLGAQSNNPLGIRGICVIKRNKKEYAFLAQAKCGNKKFTKEFKSITDAMIAVHTWREKNMPGAKN